MRDPIHFHFLHENIHGTTCTSTFNYLFGFQRSSEPNVLCEQTSHLGEVAWSFQFVESLPSPVRHESFLRPGRISINSAQTEAEGKENLCGAGDSVTDLCSLRTGRRRKHVAPARQGRPWWQGAALPPTLPQSPALLPLSSTPGGFRKLVPSQDPEQTVRPAHSHGGGLRKGRASQKTHCPAHGVSRETQIVGPLCPLPFRAAWSVTGCPGPLPSPDPPEKPGWRR